MSYRSRDLLCLLGDVEVHHAYYHCTTCKRGVQAAPLPLAAGQRRLSLAAEEVVCLEASKESFEKAASSLLKLTGLRLSEETVRRAAEDAGKHIGERLAQEETFGEKCVWPWPKDAEGRTCAYVSVDATGIGMQGPHGAKREGRMPYVGMIYFPTPDSPEKPTPLTEGRARYLAGLMSLDELGPLLRRQGAQVGMDEAQQWIGLSDGGAGLDSFLDVNFPRAQRILDFWHAAQHLAELAVAYHSNDTPAAEELFAAWRHQLRHEGGKTLLQTLLNFYVQDRSQTVQEIHRRLLEYVRANVHRMDYPTYGIKGWQIGSGPVESACKMVVNQRLCQGGMRWGEPGADAMCHLRALYRSERSQWDDYWRSRVAVAL